MTPLTWQLRRDRDLLLAEIEHRAEGIGKIWIEKIEVTTQMPAAPSAGGPTANPVLELGALMRGDIVRQHGVRELVRDLVTELRADLPVDLRAFAGDDEAALEAFIDRLLADGSDEILARLTSASAEPA